MTTFRVDANGRFDLVFDELIRLSLVNLPCARFLSRNREDDETLGPRRDGRDRARRKHKPKWS
jgi:hypothetical protein